MRAGEGAPGGPSVGPEQGAGGGRAPGIPAAGPRRPRRGPGRVLSRLSVLVVLLLLALPPRPAAAQEALPGDFRLGGGVYLYHYAPLDLEGVEGKTEVYALYLDLDRSDGPWRIHVQGRWRDTRLRSFYPSSVWVQQAWVAYRFRPGRGSATPPEPAGHSPRSLTVELKAGKLYQRVGRFWDGSFFGNVHYFDGLKLDPEFGVEAEARVPLGRRLEMVAHGQALLESDRVNGALAGRDVESLAGAEEEGGSAGLRLRAELGTAAGRPLSAEAGVSGLLERALVPAGGAGDGDVTTHVHHLALDGELSWGPVIGYAEWTRRADGVAGTAPGSGADLGRLPVGSRADYWLVGVQAGLGPLDLRYNYSRAGYGDAGAVEHLHQPGLTLRLEEGVAVLLEYDDWRREPEGAAPEAGALPAAGPLRLDRSLNAVLHLRF